MRTDENHVEHLASCTWDALGVRLEDRFRVRLHKIIGKRLYNNFRLRLFRHIRRIGNLGLNIHGGSPGLNNEN